MEFDRWFNYFAFDVLGEVIFSKLFGFVESGTDIRNAIANTRALALYIAVMGHYTWLHHLTLGNPILSRLGIQPSSHIFDTCLAAIDTRKKNPESRNDMMQRWLDVRSKYPDRMAESEVFAAAVANIGAGADTVSATAQALFYCLIRSPHHLRRVREEIDAAQARGDLSPLVQYAEAQKLPFLQACVCFTCLLLPLVIANEKVDYRNIPPPCRRCLWSSTSRSGGWHYNWKEILCAGRTYTFIAEWIITDFDSDNSLNQPMGLPPKPRPLRRRLRHLQPGALAAWYRIPDDGPIFDRCKLPAHCFTYIFYIYMHI